MSDIEEDVKILNNLKRYLNILIYEGQHKIFYNDLGYDEKTIDCINALEHILAERKQDKARIKELEEENKRKDMFVEMAKEVIENSIPKQKVKEKIEEIKEDKESKYFDTFLMARDINYAIDILKELLEDK